MARGVVLPGIAFRYFVAVKRDPRGLGGREDPENVRLVLARELQLQRLTRVDCKRGLLRCRVALRVPQRELTFAGWVYQLGGKRGGIRVAEARVGPADL